MQHFTDFQLFLVKYGTKLFVKGPPRPSFSPAPTMTGPLGASRMGMPPAAVSAPQPMSVPGQPSGPHGYPGDYCLQLLIETFLSI